MTRESDDDKQSKILINSYYEVVNSRIRKKWNAYLLSLMFDSIRGHPSAVKYQMLKAAERLYGLCLTRIVRNPKAPSAELPIWIIVPDFPVPKRVKLSLADVALNGGLHLGGIALIPPESRLRESLSDHFDQRSAAYIKGTPGLRRLVATPITETPKKAVRYTFKSISRRRSSFDDVLILTGR